MNFKFKILNFSTKGRSASGGKTKSAGLTLVESMVALMVLSLGLIPALTILSSSVKLASLIKNNLIAANLAQEGVEVVRSLRDANWFANPPVGGLPFSTGLIGTWSVERDTRILGTPVKPPVPANSNILLNPPLKFDSTTGTYNYSTGLDTSFRRLVTVTLSPSACACELIVVSTVTWPTSGGGTKSVNVESHLYNWK